MFKHLLVPTDGSPLSKLTVARALSFAGETGAKITFFFAKPDFPIALYGEGALVDPTTPEQFAKLAEQQAREILDTCIAQAETAGVSCASLSHTGGSVHAAIVAAANEAGADLIFMASHGRKGLSSLLLGSETYRVLAHSTIPVLVFRQPATPK